MSTDWIPIDLMTVGQRQMVRWIHPGEQIRFQEPFFHQSIDLLLRANAVQKLTAIDALAAASAANAPRGFIFHVARCGSTLVSRSLAGVPRHRVISEPRPVNQLLLAPQGDPQRQGALLKGLIHALCGSDAARPCLIKFTSWNLLFLEQIRAQFPATPFIFVYREPAAVLRSLCAQAPHWAANPVLMRLLGQGEAGKVALVPALQRLFEAALPHWGGHARAFNYAQLPAALPEVAAHFGCALAEDEWDAVLRIGQFDAKQAGAVPYRARERAPLPPALANALGPLDALYQQWETIRSADVH